MSIWNDAFEAYLEAAEMELDDILQTSDEKEKISEVMPKAIYVMMVFDENGQLPSAGEESAATKQHLKEVKRQYEALVKEFGEEAIDAARRALEARRKSLEDNSPDDSE